MRAPFLALLLLLLPATTQAERFTVRMLNRNATGGMVYEPDYLRVQPGDTVKFIAADVTHNAAFMAEMLPPGGRPFKGQINQEIEMTFDAPGLHGVRCIPHWAMGMVMLVQVGDPGPAAPVLPADLPPVVRKRFDEILAREAGRRGE